MDTNVPFINLEYIFTRIYDFLIYVKNVILTGDIHSGDFGNIFPWIVTLSTFFVVGMIIWMIYVRIRIFEVDEKLDGAYKGHFIKPETKSLKVNTRWQTILTHFSSSNPNDWRAAIIDADAMLDELVTSMGYTGDGLGAEAHFNSYQ
jgi:hypothetical protein